MAKLSVPRSGSLQYWPRKKARRILPRVNWGALEDKGLLGFIGYKAGMKTAIVKDMTANSMTKDKQISVPASIVEVPPMRIISARFYKDKKVLKDIIFDNNKILKNKIKVSKNLGKAEDLDSAGKDADDVRIIVYSEAEKTGIKNTPDIAEIGLGGKKEEKIALVKSMIGKEIRFGDFFKAGELTDIHGVTKGKGIVGPVKRMGISLKAHKSEKGVRRPGNLAPWHPARVTFRVAQMGQMGFFTRVGYNSKIISIGKIAEKDINPGEGFKHYGKIKEEYALIRGSIAGTEKRQIMITRPVRKTKKQEKKKFELKEII
ncbi:MAG: 50S ribosomal protein L3 [Nanoarchaeota archaeon]